MKSPMGIRSALFCFSTPIRLGAFEGYSLSGFGTMQFGIQKTRHAPHRPRGEILNASLRRRTLDIESRHALPVQFRAFLTLLVLALVLNVPSPAAARDTAARKVGRGAANLTLGVLALPGQIVRTTRASGPFVGATWGLVKGVGMFVATEIVGVFEVLTSPFETPPGFKPILKPEYPWGYFFEEPR